MRQLNWSHLFRLVLSVAALLLAVLPSAAQQASGDSCSGCHDTKLKTAHGPIACLTCHAKHEDYPHPAPAVKPACATCHGQVSGDHARSVHGRELANGNSGAPGCATCHGSAHDAVKIREQAFRAGLPDTCGMCHAEVSQQFRISVHGKAVERGIPQAPLCTDCHGEHNIERHTLRSSNVHPSHQRETCGRCHGDVRLMRKFGLPVDRLVSFDASFHGLAAQAGSQTVASCASCHGIHNILPSGDTKSTIHPKNLAATCGACHPGAGKRFTLGPIHQWEGRAEPVAVGWVRGFYLWIIPGVIGLMLLHNLGDWVRKLGRLRFSQNWQAAGFDEAQLRMFPAERLQHALLVVSFTVLAWTGFALKYPAQWWAVPLTAWESTWPVRSWVHRGAAAVFVVVSIAHLLALVYSPRLRRHWLELIPRADDIKEAWRNFAYNLGYGSKPPGRSHHSYVEKAEYWAVVWGSVVMAVSGFMLWANNLMLAMLPKSFLDVATVIHFYEAVLATLAIVVWHFYWVIFDPDVYPLDSAFLTGRSARKRGPHS
ncbi:MAG: cytochrome b/b6 domain-containing protein [Acidobacteriia bacterium]|nr:cytochrome b/b6 domain-containing protein [Terriglobia bacterium]